MKKTIITLLSFILLNHCTAQVEGILNSCITYYQTNKDLAFEVNAGIHAPLFKNVDYTIEAGAILELKPNVKNGDFFGIKTGLIYSIRQIDITGFIGGYRMQKSNDQTKAYSQNYFTLCYAARAGTTIIKWDKHKFDINLNYNYFPKHGYMAGAGCNFIF